MACLLSCTSVHLQVSLHTCVHACRPAPQIWGPIVVGVGMAIWRLASGKLVFDSAMNILLSLVLIVMPLTWWVEGGVSGWWVGDWVDVGGVGNIPWALVSSKHCA